MKMSFFVLEPYFVTFFDFQLNNLVMAKIKNRNKPKNKQNVAKKLHKKLKKEKRPFENAPIANISSAEDVNLVTKKKKKKRNKKNVQENGVLSPVQWLDEPGSGSTEGGKTAPIPVKKSKKKKKKANQKKQSEGLEKQQNGLGMKDRKNDK